MRRLSAPKPLFVVSLIGFLSFITACECGRTRCSSSLECAGLICVDGRCRAPSDGGDLDTSVNGEDAGCPAPGFMCGDACCAASDRCWNGSTCIPDRGECASPDDCWSDTRCVDGICVPWGTGSTDTFDDSCTRAIDIESIEPEVQCRWEGPPSG